jgi:MtN3 and saliva related transmembrane protein
MSFVEILGFVASAFSTGSALPQLYKIIKSKSAKDVSISMFVILATGNILWFIYALLIGSMPLLIANVILFTISVTIIYFSLKYSKEKVRVKAVN